VIGFAEARVELLSENRFGILVLGISVPLLVVSLALLLHTAEARFIDQDELEHLNAASFIAQGETLYVSFFENHPPLMPLVLQPIVRSSDDPEVVIARGRMLSFVFACGILLGVAWIAHQLAGSAAAAIAPLLLLTHLFFFEKVLEVRPDVPSTLLLVTGLAALMQGVRRGAATWFAAAGAVLALGGLFTPKILYAAAGGTIGAGLAIATRRDALRWRDAMRSLAWVGAGVLGVSVLAGLEMARQGILAGFIEDCVRVSLSMTVPYYEIMRVDLLTASARRNGGFWGLGLAGLVLMAASARERTNGGSTIVASSAVVGALGLFLIRSPHRQYYLTFLPQLAVAGSFALVTILDRLRRLSGRWSAAITALALIAAFAVTLGPGFRLLRAERPSMAAQILTIRQVLRVTQPGDRVLDCWNGLYLGRLPAYRYFYINPAILSVIDPAQVERDLRERLQDPAVQVVLEGRFYELLPAPIRREIRQRFERLPRSIVRVRREPSARRGSPSA
jgi:4-amino-4-deoxy-L-arabinose transferase-like glycosyltransferase